MLSPRPHACGRRPAMVPAVAVALLVVTLPLVAAPVADIRPDPQQPQAAASTGAKGSFRIPNLSDEELQRFEPSISEQIRGALRQAEQEPNAETIGALGLVLHAYEQYDRAAVCYGR